MSLSFGLVNILQLRDGTMGGSRPSFNGRPGPLDSWRTDYSSTVGSEDVINPPEPILGRLTRMNGQKDVNPKLKKKEKEVGQRNLE